MEISGQEINTYKFFIIILISIYTYMLKVHIMYYLKHATCVLNSLKYDYKRILIRATIIKNTD